ncbi:MAG: glycosyltransferase [Candidatus Micrarchaeales archaeon]|uniref:Glycosyl transferase group 1 n=1 Tax=Candidatus Micrarchaeum acidiphilum ARMAN-2 TaxID=425595 RepID=C7DIP6_MICA2|nr:MAG: glycosyl transferase group 1 [Candidatus Micrarchaeum acidiphilum ARMAN-2]MCW6161604.1 glycosyltransferase [Candidatus Micrarchaeales archaeon]
MQDHLKIQFFTDTFLPSVDGVVSSMLNFKQELEKRGHEVFIIASGDSRTKAAVKKNDRTIILPSIKFKKYPQYNLAWMPLIASIKFGFSKFDITHLHTPFTVGMYGLLYAKLNKTPTVGSFHTLFTRSEVIKQYTTSNKVVQRFLIKSSWPYAKFFYGKCNGVIAPSTSIKNLLNRHSIGNSYVVPNSVDTKKFNPNVNGEKIRRKYLKSERERLVLYVGRISVEKNIEVMLKAAKILKKKQIYRFLIAGTGPMLDYYKNMAAKYGLADIVHFSGFVDERELPRYYAAADVFCMPSTFETQGIVSLEAMASGVPVVGADYLALREMIINGKNGEKFAPRNGDDCAHKIEKVINNLGYYKKMVDTAKMYSVEKSTDKLLEVYKALLDKNGN